MKESASPSQAPRLLLSMVVVHHPDLQHRITLRDHNPPRIVPLPIHDSESPDLPPRPALLLIVHETLHEQLSIRARLLLITRQPALLQEVIGDVLEARPAGLPHQLAEDMVLVLALRPVQRALLRRALDAPRRRLVDVDVRHPVFQVLLRVQRDGREADGFARPPSDALEDEDGIGVVREGFILCV